MPHGGCTSPAAAGCGSVRCVTIAEPVADESHALLLSGVRVAILALCAGLAGLTGQLEQPALWLAGLAAAAGVGSLPAVSARWRLALPVGECIIAALVIGQAPGGPAPLLPYLLAPAFAAGLVNGALWPPIVAAAADLIISAQSLLVRQQDLRTFFSTVTTWVLLSLAVGLLGAWVRRLRQQPAAEVDPSYAAAYRLLSQLHIVSRQLSAGLDPVALAESLLEKVRRHVHYERAAILVRSPGGRLVPLTTQGADPVDWEAEPKEDSALLEAWATGEPLQRPLPPSSTATGHVVVLPLRFGVRTFGLVVMESSEAARWPEVEGAQALASETALPLETALLFADIRSIATSEERRRLAREIHDGIAQELASLGYAIDDLTARAELPDLENDLAKLRGEITRLVTELRFSIFDLRSEVASAGLGTTLADYVRQVGAGSQLTVHLLLDESPMRLRLETEAELLRIAQEAVTNVRKHAGAKNLWVTCRLAPPSALVRVEDDGRGLGAKRLDSFGMEIMKERSARIGAKLRVARGVHGGAVVEVTLGPVPAAWSATESEVREAL